MEDSITMEELYALQGALYRSEHRRNKVLAAVQGIDIDEDEVDDQFEAVKRRAEAELAGKSEEQMFWEKFDMSFESDFDDD